MANVVMDNETFDKGYRRLKPLGATFFEHLIFKAQERRSHGLNQIQKLDFFDSRNYFKNEFSRIAMEENLKSKTMDELKEMIFVRLTQWLERELPKNYLYGYWKLYYRRLMERAIDSHQTSELLRR